MASLKEGGQCEELDSMREGGWHHKKKQVRGEDGKMCTGEGGKKRG